jgi:hypothetical protein
LDKLQDGQGSAGLQDTTQKPECAAASAPLHPTHSRWFTDLFFARGQLR